MGVVQDVPKYRYSSTRSASNGRRETIARARARAREPARAIACCSASSSFPGTTRSCACGV